MVGSPWDVSATVLEERSAATDIPSLFPGPALGTQLQCDSVTPTAAPCLSKGIGLAYSLMYLFMIGNSPVATNTSDKPFDSEFWTLAVDPFIIYTRMKREKSSI